MIEDFGEILHQELLHSYHEELKRYQQAGEDSYVLDAGNQKVLIEKILALPDKLQFMLFGKYCFYLQEQDIEMFFDAPMAKAELLYGVRLLSDAMGLMNHETLSHESLKKACKKALKEYIRQETFAKEETAVLIPAKILRYLKIMAKNVAIFILVLLTILAGAMSVNADFREKVIYWFIKTYKEYSAFEMRSNETKTEEDLKKYQPLYIPLNFKLVNKIENEDNKYFEYETDNKKRLDILIGIPNNIMYTDTENAVVEETTYEGNPAYYYEKENMVYLMFEKDGYQIFIFGHITKEELLKVADHIQKIN